MIARGGGGGPFARLPPSLVPTDAIVHPEHRDDPPDGGDEERDRGREVDGDTVDHDRRHEVSGEHHRDRHRNEARDEEAIREDLEVLLVPDRTRETTIRGRHDEQDEREERREEGDDVNDPPRRVELPELLREGERREEAEKDLGAREEEARLVQQLGQLRLLLLRVALPRRFGTRCRRMVRWAPTMSVRAA